MFLRREQIWLTAEEVELLIDGLNWCDSESGGEIDGLDKLRNKLRVVAKSLSEQKDQE